MTTFSEINGTDSRGCGAEPLDIRYLLWQLGDGLGLEPPPEEDEHGGANHDNRRRRLALADAVSTDQYAGIYDEYPYRCLFTSYTLEELRDLLS